MEGDHVKLKVPKVENPKTEACFSGGGEQPGVAWYVVCVAGLPAWWALPATELVLGWGC